MNDHDLDFRQPAAPASSSLQNHRSPYLGRKATGIFVAALPFANSRGSANVIATLIALAAALPLPEVPMRRITALLRGAKHFQKIGSLCRMGYAHVVVPDPIGVDKLMSGSSITAIVGAETSVIQKLLMQAADRWRGEGLKVCGIVESVTDGSVRACGSSVLRNIETGETFAMFLKEAPAHTSCILDEVGVVDACGSVIDSIQSSDLVILSKFGKVESVGSGLFDAFQTAVSLSKPILTSVAPKFHYFWNRFAPEATFIRPDRWQIEEWKSDLMDRMARAA